MRLQSPDEMFQMRTVQSDDAEATAIPVGENATDQTQSVCPSNVLTRPPVCRSQILTVASSDPDATSTSSGKNATEFISLLCPFKVARHTPVAASKIWTTALRLAAIKLPLCENATKSTRLTT